jgi:hypothetical protein
MLRIFCCLLITVSIVLAQSGAPAGAAKVPATKAAQVVPASAGAARPDVFRKEYPALQKAVDAAIGEVPGISILQTSKATYLEDFGVVVVIETALERPRNPFESPAPGGARTLQDKVRLIREKAQQVLAQQAGSVQSINPDQSLVIAVHIFNANPVDAPNLPVQIVFKVKKQEPSRVVVREL